MLARVKYAASGPAKATGAPDKVKWMPLKEGLVPGQIGPAC